MKKRSVLIILVAITLLSSIFLSSILGVTKAEYFKKLSKALDFEAGPDLALQYALWDANGTDDKAESKKREWEDGVYKNSKSFSQDIVVGRNDAYTTGIYSGAAWIGDQKSNFVASKYPEINLSDSTKNKIAMNAENFKYNGENMYWNHWLHKWTIYSTSPFADACAFITQAQSINSVSVTPSTATAAAGSTVQFTATVTGSDFINKAVKWSVSDGASVDVNGLVTIDTDATGTVTVTATAVADATKTATATITIS
jgi:hypothetical protein